MSLATKSPPSHPLNHCRHSSLFKVEGRLVEREKELVTETESQNEINGKEEDSNVTMNASLPEADDQIDFSKENERDDGDQCVDSVSDHIVTDCELLCEIKRWVFHIEVTQEEKPDDVQAPNELKPGKHSLRNTSIQPKHKETLK